MKKITAVIIDDEGPARQVIRTYLREYADIEVKAECSNGFEGLKKINQLEPDLVFLDIQMPKITGFEMLELLENVPVLIFSTAYDQYALKAFEVSAADYLLKPYSRERFAEAISRARIFMQDRTLHQKVLTDLVAHREQQVEVLQRVVVKSGRQIHIIAVDRLLWLEAQDDYVLLHTKDGDFLKAKTMKYFEAHLDPKEFVRIHRSHLVSVAFIKQIELFGKESYRAVLKSGVVLPVSRSGHAKLKEMLG
ncbi:MAG: LytR/AlgR family response regulator transcription factor [bacterium]